MKSKSKPPKFVLGGTELDILAFLSKQEFEDDVISYLLKHGKVTSKSSAEKALSSLRGKGFTSTDDQKEIRVTEAGKFLQKALTITRVIAMIANVSEQGGKED